MARQKALAGLILGLCVLAAGNGDSAQKRAAEARANAEENVLNQKGPIEEQTVAEKRTSEDKAPGERKVADLQAGAASVDITPPTGFPLWGHPSRHDAPSVGIRDPLYAKALVLAVGKNRIALVGLDLGRAPTRQSTAAIRLRVKAATGINHVFLVASHTHCGPYLEMDNWPSPNTV